MYVYVCMCVCMTKISICFLGNNGKVRLESCVPQTSGRILYCTTGILLMRLRKNPYLEGESALVREREGGREREREGERERGREGGREGEG